MHVGVFAGRGMDLVNLLNGHQVSTKDSARAPWYSDLNSTDFSPKQGRRVRSKVDTKAFHHMLQAKRQQKLKMGVSILCSTAYPGAHEFGNANHHRVNRHKEHGLKWFMDNPVVLQSISRSGHSESPRSLRTAIEELSSVLDKLYPADPRFMLDALANSSDVIEPKFLFTMRSLPSLVNSQNFFDGGVCRHGLILAAILSYFGTITKSLPRNSWRVVWYESMQNRDTRALFEIELAQWLGFNVRHESWQPGDWHGSTKTLQYTGTLGWTKMVEEALAVNGSFGKLLNHHYQLGFNKSSVNRTNETVHRLRALVANAEHMGEVHNLDDERLWDPEWNCSEEHNWYTDPSR